MVCRVCCAVVLCVLFPKCCNLCVLCAARVVVRVASCAASCRTSCVVLPACFATARGSTWQLRPWPFRSAFPAQWSLSQEGGGGRHIFTAQHKHIHTPTYTRVNICASIDIHQHIHATYAQHIYEQHIQKIYTSTMNMKKKHISHITHHTSHITQHTAHSTQHTTHCQCGVCGFHEGSHTHAANATAVCHHV